MVVLAEHPRRVVQQVGDGGAEVVGHWQGVVGAGREPGRPVGRLGPGAVEQRGVIVERRGRHVGQHVAVRAVEDPQAAPGGDRADHRGGDLPPVADGQQLVEVLGLDDRQHPLLALAGEHLERLHARLALGDLGHVDVHAHPAPAGRLAGGAREPGAAEVLDADHEVGVEHLEAGLDEPLLLERVTHLDARPLGRVGVVAAEPRRRQHRHPADAVAPGGRPEQHGEIADTGGPAEHEPLDRQDAEAENVHQRVVLIGLVEHDLAAHGGDAHRVAIAADARHDTFGDPPTARVRQRTEAKRVHQGDGPRPHREHIAQDAADAGGRTLIGLDRRGVVVALDPERHRDAVSGVDDSGVLARTHEHGRAFGGKPAEMQAARLVRAVLGPHHCVHRQLEVIGRPAEDPPDGGGLVVGEPEGPVDRLVGGHRATLGHSPECSDHPEPAPGNAAKMGVVALK